MSIGWFRFVVYEGSQFSTSCWYPSQNISQLEHIIQCVWKHQPIICIMCNWIFSHPTTSCFIFPTVITQVLKHPENSYSASDIYLEPFIIGALNSNHDIVFWQNTQLKTFKEYIKCSNTGNGMRKTINTCDYRKLDGNHVYYKIAEFQIQSDTHPLDSLFSS
jgi:hypothetical protein